MEELTKQLLGKTYEEAKLVCVKKGFKHRVVEEDGVVYCITTDFNPYRVNFTIKNDVVTEVTFE